MEAAFTLLLAPLAEVQEQVVMVIDALDEGDPPEQQKPGFKGGIMACGNKPLMLVLNCLASKLPANVRFIFTSRPDAVCGGIQAILKRAFPPLPGSAREGVRFMSLHEIRLDSAGDKRGTSGGGGPPSAAAPPRASSSSARVMVLETIFRECGLSDMERVQV